MSCANQSQDAWHEPLDEGGEISIFPEDQAKAKNGKNSPLRSDHAPGLGQGSHPSSSSA
jgi:hypothetical protein